MFHSFARLIPTVAVVVALLAIRAHDARAADGDSQTPWLAPAREIDRRLEAFWRERGVEPAAEAEPVELVRRLTLDLAGRIPTRAEWEAYVKDPAKRDAARDEAIRRLLDGPEFALHWGAQFDEQLQGSLAGNAEFVDYLRRRLQARRPWSEIFRELMLGPWDTDDSKPAVKFLDSRARDIDRLTVDATRAFFAVDISCARCHDHPLVDAWKQDHYYGMASFFNRTTGDKGKVNEKTEGDVSFKTRDGQQKTAKPMFLSGRTLDDPAPPAKPSRREQLVRAALDDGQFLARAVVNRVWQTLLSRGLVEPIDQLHEGNPPAVPGLLEWLADDFIASGYDLRRLVGAVASCSAYRLSSVSTDDRSAQFAAAPLRPLSRRQFAMSLVVAAGRVDLDFASPIEQRTARASGAPGLARTARYLEAEERASAIVARLDVSGDAFANSTDSLFLANGGPVADLFRAADGTLAARLAQQIDNKKAVDSAVREILSRPPTPAELDSLAKWLETPGAERSRACEQLVWALAMSAEFRFNH